MIERTRIGTTSEIHRNLFASCEELLKTPVIFLYDVSLEKKIDSGTRRVKCIVV